MKKRVLITGASGLLGRAIVKEFTQSENGWEVLGLAYSRAKGALRKVDLKSKDEVDSVVGEFKPSIVIHSAAERRPDVVEKKEEETKMLNVNATRTIAEASAKANAFFLYISTDYVFDGTNPPYKPTDKPNPLNKYGQSKLDGENVTLEFLPRSGVLRVPILYGPVEHIHESAVTGNAHTNFVLQSLPIFTMFLYFLQISLAKLLLLLLKSTLLIRELRTLFFKCCLINTMDIPLLFRVTTFILRHTNEMLAYLVKES